MKSGVSILTKSVPLLTLINNRKHNGTAQKASPVELRITYQGKQKYIATGVKVRPSEWDRVNESVKRRADAAQLNEILFNFKSDVLEAVMMMHKEGTLNLSTFGDFLKHKGSKNSFLDFIEKRINERKDVSQGTARRWRAWLRQMRLWGGIRSFDDVTKDNIYALTDYLQERGLKQTTICGYHKCMKLFIGDAVRNNFLSENPYQKYDIEIGRGEPCMEKFLTNKDVEMLTEVKLPEGGYIDKARDLFLFQCLTGLAYKDLATFNPQWVEKGTDGIAIYTNRRKKTLVPFVFVLLPKAMKILEKYGGKLPVMGNPQYNLRLKVVAEAAGIKKPISSHWGRHTAAMVWLNNGIPLEVVSRCLGHSSTSVTQKVYARLENSTIRKAFEGLNLSDWMK